MAKRAQRLIDYYYEFTGGSNDPVPEDCRPKGKPQDKPKTSLDAVDSLFDKSVPDEPGYDPDAIGEHGDDGEACCAACALTGGCCQDDKAKADAEAEANADKDEPVPSET